MSDTETITKMPCPADEPAENRRFRAFAVGMLTRLGEEIEKRGGSMSLDMIDSLTLDVFNATDDGIGFYVESMRYADLLELEEQEEEEGDGNGG